MRPLRREREIGLARQARRGACAQGDVVGMPGREARRQQFATANEIFLAAGHGGEGAGDKFGIGKRGIVDIGERKRHVRAFYRQRARGADQCALREAARIGQAVVGARVAGEDIDARRGFTGNRVAGEGLAESDQRSRSVHHLNRRGPCAIGLRLVQRHRIGDGGLRPLPRRSESLRDSRVVLLGNDLELRAISGKRARQRIRLRANCVRNDGPMRRRHGRCDIGRDERLLDKDWLTLPFRVRAGLFNGAGVQAIDAQASPSRRIGNR